MKSIPQSSLGWMPKSVWGKIKWIELHSRALSRLPMQGEKEWFESFVQSIPCKKCQKHFEIFTSENPPDFTSRANFFRWTVAAHNAVNRANKKEEMTNEQALVLHAAVLLEEPQTYEEI